MANPIKPNQLEKGDIFSFELDGKQYEVFRKGTYKMLLQDEVGALLPFHYFIHLKPIYKHG